MVTLSLLWLKWPSSMAVVHTLPNSYRKQKDTIQLTDIRHFLTYFIFA